jgi:HAE1 family hydrophobic/amphiphilic exporter-1
MYIRANDHYRVKSEDFKNLYARNARGEMVPLGGLLEAKHSQGSEMISRYNLYSAVAIFGSAAPGSSSGQALTLMEWVDSLFSPRLVQVGWWTWWSGRPFESRRGEFPLQFCIQNA